MALIADGEVSADSELCRFVVGGEDGGKGTDGFKFDEVNGWKGIALVISLASEFIEVAAYSGCFGCEDITGNREVEEEEEVDEVDNVDDVEECAGESLLEEE